MRARTLKQAVVVGSALASFTCEAFGTEGIREVTQGQLDERLEAFRRMTAWTEQVVPA